MSEIALHLDEDTDSDALIRALRRHGVTVSSTREEKLTGISDIDQLSWAIAHGRVLYTYNASDFYRIHSDKLRAHETHTGIIIGDQQTTSVGEELRRLLRLMRDRLAADMISRVEFLSNFR